jgi:hypothetical protein
VVGGELAGQGRAEQAQVKAAAQERKRGVGDRVELAA